MSAGSTISAGISGTVIVVGNGGSSSFGNSNYGVNVSGTSSVITSSGGNVSVTGTEGTGTGSIGIITQSSGSITTASNGGNLTLNAKSMSIQTGSAISAKAASSVTLRTPDNIQIDLGTAGDAIGGPLGLTDAELDLVTGSTITIGHALAGNSKENHRTPPPHESQIHREQLGGDCGGF